MKANQASLLIPSVSRSCVPLELVSSSWSGFPGYETAIITVKAWTLTLLNAWLPRILRDVWTQNCSSLWSRRQKRSRNFYHTTNIKSGYNWRTWFWIFNLSIKNGNPTHTTAFYSRTKPIKMLRNCAGTTIKWGQLQAVDQYNCAISHTTRPRTENFRKGTALKKLTVFSAL